MKIEINLLPGVKKKRGGGGVGMELPDVRKLFTQVKDPLLLGVIGSWVAAVAFVAGIYSIESAKIQALEPQVQSVGREARRYQFMIAEKDRTIVLRDSLAAELAAIREIDGNRFVWPHIMEEVSRALPQFTWIVSLDAITTQDVVLDDGTIVAGPIRFNIDGRTSDLQAFTRFVSQLQDSPWLRNVQPGGTRSVLENDRQVTGFSVQVTYAEADSAFIRVVPVDQIFGQGG